MAHDADGVSCEVEHGTAELPRSITASVWKSSASGIVLYTVFGRQRALIQPTLIESMSPLGPPVQDGGTGASRQLT